MDSSGVAEDNKQQAMSPEDTNDNNRQATKIPPETEEDTQPMLTDSPAVDADTKHEFDCEELSPGKLGTAQNQIPLACVARGGEKPRTLYFVINEDEIAGDISRLWDENVKVVIKQLMVMDISPK